MGRWFQWRLAVGLLVAWMAWGAASAWAQLGQKPSGYQPHTGNAAAPVDGSQPGWTSRLGSRAEFDRYARVYDAGTALALPHVLFVIDRGQGDRVYFIQSRRYALHEQFLKARDHVSDFDAAGFKDNYRSPQRRYVLGTLAWRAQAKAWAYEFWEGDQLTPELLRLAQRRLGEQFFAPLRFKPNSVAQEALAQGLHLPVLTQADVIAQQGYLPLNQGRAVGRLRVVAAGQTLDALEPDDIVVLQEVPLNIPPVSGIITTRPSTTLSHVNLFVKFRAIISPAAASDTS